MLTKEQRAHDIALAILSNIINKEVDGFPDKLKTKDLVMSYEHAYKNFLSLFEEKF